ncbi:MAG: DUF5642 family protein [Mycobacteriaceae bacterium]|nr:DUF5642 family protein [Mycobacteriaceae bacterium]
MSIQKAMFGVMCAGLLGGCTGVASPAQRVDIGKVFAVKSTFGPDFRVTTAGPSGIDPKLLAPQKLPEGMTFDPADCAKYASGQTLPAGLQGNMAAVSAEGQGNRFIAIAVETSERVPFDAAAADTCKHVTFAGPNMHGVVDVVDSPHIDGAQTLGTHRQLSTAVGTGEVYNYVAYLDDYLVVVTANPLVVPNQPTVPVNTQRAKDLLSATVGAVRG